MLTETQICTGAFEAPGDERVITPFTSAGRSSSRPFRPARFRLTCNCPGPVPEADSSVIHFAFVLAVQARPPSPLLMTVRAWAGGSCPGTKAYILKLRRVGEAARVDFGFASTLPAGAGVAGVGAVGSASQAVRQSAATIDPAARGSVRIVGSPASGGRGRTAGCLAIPNNH